MRPLAHTELNPSRKGSATGLSTQTCRRAVRFPALEGSQSQRRATICRGNIEHNFQRDTVLDKYDKTHSASACLPTYAIPSYQSWRQAAPLSHPKIVPNYF